MTDNVIYPIGSKFPIVSTLLSETKILYFEKQKLATLMLFFCVRMQKLFYPCVILHNVYPALTKSDKTC